jgi:ribulose-5-phosphate 4-epimerase/fuculose-1-phosphate aldolase
MTSPAGASLRERVVAIATRLRREGLVVGTSGNVSARLEGTDACLITPSGVDYEELEPGDLVLVGFDGRVREGRLKPSSDTPTHLAVYHGRPDVGAVIHTHSPHAAAFSVVGLEIPAVVIDAAGFLGGPVPLVGDLPRSGRAVLLRNHGVLCAGETLDKALTAARLVEHMARVAYLAMALGKPALVPPSEIERMRAFLHGGYGQD